MPLAGELAMRLARIASMMATLILCFGCCEMTPQLDEAQTGSVPEILKAFRIAPFEEESSALDAPAVEPGRVSITIPAREPNSFNWHDVQVQHEAFVCKTAVGDGQFASIAYGSDGELLSLTVLTYGQQASSVSSKIAIEQTSALFGAPAVTDCDGQRFVWHHPLFFRIEVSLLPNSHCLLWRIETMKSASLLSNFLGSQGHVIRHGLPHTSRSNLKELYNGDR